MDDLELRVLESETIRDHAGLVAASVIDDEDLEPVLIFERFR